jgi:hypothetical protein
MRALLWRQLRARGIYFAQPRRSKKWKFSGSATNRNSNSALPLQDHSHDDHGYSQTGQESPANRTPNISSSNSTADEKKGGVINHEQDDGLGTSNLGSAMTYALLSVSHSRALLWDCRMKQLQLEDRHACGCSATPSHSKPILTEPINQY